MQGHVDIIQQLNDLLANELTAIDQYFIHSRIYEDMGLMQLFTRIDHEMQDEQRHADLLIKRILFLQGAPDIVKRVPVKVGKDVLTMLQNDLNLEYQVIDDLKKVIVLCEQKQDFETRNLLTELLADTEKDHTFWLEQQLKLIQRLGLENYQQSQM